MSFLNDLGTGLMAFTKSYNDAQDSALKRQQMAEMAALRQAQLGQMAFNQQRQEKGDWWDNYERGMKQQANAYLSGKLTGQNAEVDPSVLGYVDPSKLAAIQELGQKRNFESMLFGGNQPSSPPQGGKTSAVPFKPTSSNDGGIDYSSAATTAGVPDLSGFLPRVVQAESGGNPNAKAGTSSARGLGQFTSATRQSILNKYGADAWSNDPQEQAQALAYLVKDNRDGLASSMGVEAAQVTPQQIYMANFLGQGGANTFLTGMQRDPNTPAVALVSPGAARANAGIFFKKDSTPRTAQEVFDLMASKVAPVQLAQAGGQTATDASAPPPAIQGQSVGTSGGGRLEQFLSAPPEQFARLLMAAPKEYREPLMGLYKQKNPEAPSSIREFQSYMNMTPEEQAKFSEYKRLSKPETNVNIDGGKKFQQTLGELWAKDYQKMFDDAANAQDVRNNIQAARQVLAGGLQTGALEPAKAGVAAVAQSFGIDPQKLGLPNASDAQKFNSVVMKNLLAELVAQKGPQTEGDASRALKTFAQLGNTPEANQFAMDYADAVAQRKQEMADYIYNAGRNQYEGDSFKGRQDWQKRINGTPLFAVSPQTGKPVTYYQFRDNAQANGLPADEIDKAWQQFAGKK